MAKQLTHAVLPTSVRYVKNGQGGRWWQAAKANGQVHLGWKSIPSDLLVTPDFLRIEKMIEAQYGRRPGAKADANALRAALDAPSRHVWITFEDGCMWWCTVLDGAKVNPNGQEVEKGNFWLDCQRPWSNRSINGKLLAVSGLPGTVTTTAGFKGTVCTPRAWPAILRIIQDEKDPDAAKAVEARQNYEQAVLKMVRRLSPRDFEQLIDLILAGTGWTRISKLGGIQEGIDLEAMNPTANETAFVQVKSSANQKDLSDYVRRFQQRRDLYARMIFAVHTPTGKLTPPAVPAVQLWTGDRVAQLAVRLGLGEWVESRLA